MSDWLDEKVFYESMQKYRLAPADDQEKVVQAFEDVKWGIRGRVRIEYREFESLIVMFKNATMDMNGEGIAKCHAEARRLGITW